MPTSNTVKKYVKDGIYHVYNRAGGHRNLYDSQKDYNFFICSLNRFLSWKELPLEKSYYYTKIKVFAFCLMPNHFHFLLQQKEQRIISRFMQSIQQSYTLHKKRTCNWRGRLYESRYKARLIEDDVDLLNISAYIHTNPLEIPKDIYKYKYSSLSAYLNSHVRSSRKMRFLNTDMLLEFFNFSPTLYRKFIDGVSASRGARVK